jgi:hypothetical protein
MLLQHKIPVKETFSYGEPVIIMPRSSSFKVWIIVMFPFNNAIS